MHWRRFFVDGLAHASYLVGSTRRGVAAVIDPQRDIDRYFQDAHETGLSIGHVFLTHLHADFVAGHMELKDRCNARIWVSKQAGARFPHQGLDDGQIVEVGDLTVLAIATPGHSPESMCFLVTDTNSGETRLFTGDTLFVGDVGRPDLHGDANTIMYAGQLYDSLFHKLLKLDDMVEVYPSHFAGSVCGRAMSGKPSSTIGFERRFNPALQHTDREAFIAFVQKDQTPAPPEFAAIRQANLSVQAVLPVEK